MWGLCRWFLIITTTTTLQPINATNNLLQVNEENLKNFLSQSEWNHISGNLNLEPSSYSIVYPQLRKNYNNFSQHLQINAENLGYNFNIELVPSPDFLSDNFQYIETFSNGSLEILSNQYRNVANNCFFRGDKAAINLCHGIKGILHSDQDVYYLIQPLPKRFPNNSHLIIRKSIKNNRNKNTLPLLRNHRSKRETFKLGSPIFVETAVFVDKDLFEHMKNNYPDDTERELIRFVLAMINAVQLLYHDPSLGRPVNFLLKRLEILKEEVAGLARPPDIDRYLSNFCNWQRTKNPSGDRDTQHWDHALILTGLDLYVRGKHGKISNQVVGLAPVAGMCTTTSSCTVNEGRHFESVYVVAHEIGHNLGMRHDGPMADNDCDPTSYIMSPTLGSGKITWSACSRRYLQTFLDTTQSHCLLDHGSSAGQLDHSAEGALPGERFDSNQQCMLKYGRGSRHSSQQPLDDVCRDLHCERERYTWTSHPALEGTKCGHNMWCKGGRCISKGYTTKKPIFYPEKTSGYWSKWRLISNDCASGCLFGDDDLRSGSTGIMIATRTCNKQSESFCDGPSKKYQACIAEQCLNVPRLTIKEFAEQICTRAKDVDKDLTGLGAQKISSDPEEACLVWCQKRNGSVKNRGWTFPDGTACQTRRNRFGRATYCINGRCEDFVCDPYDEAAYAQNPDFCPVDRNDNEIWRIGLRSRQSVIKWKSASGCHFNCITPGSGIRLVVSKGKNGRSSIQLCQPDQFGCGQLKSSFQHATMICTKYKERVRRLSGLGMQISAIIEDPDRSCRIACQDERISHRFYLVNGEEGWFPFGTDCSRGTSNKKAYCISGKCLEFGSDDTPLSENEFTLPLLSRNKRSLVKNKTKITVRLNQDELNQIILALNRTISGYYVKNSYEIDLNNPIDDYSNYT